jgi:hypothetical protein
MNVSGSFVATGQSAAFIPVPGPHVFLRGSGHFNVTIYGTFAGTVQLQRSFDAGTTWHTVSKDSSGSDAAYSAPISLVCLEPENNVQYRLNCSVYSSGTINYRLSR